MNELFNLFTSKFTTTRKLGKNLFTVFASFIHHVATLLLSKFNFRFRIGSCVFTPAHRF